MVFGYSQGGSFSQHKQALGFDAATSEQMRLKHIAEQRKRELQMRAKQDIQTKKARLRMVQNEISRMESESRRLSANESKLSSSHGHIENFDQKIRDLKNKQTAFNTELSELQRKLDKVKISIRDIERELERVGVEKIYAEKTALNNSRDLSVIQDRKKRETSEIVKFKDEEKKLEADIRELERIAGGV